MSESKKIKVELTTRQLAILVKFSDTNGLLVEKAAEYLLQRALDDILRSGLFGRRL